MTIEFLTQLGVEQEAAQQILTQYNITADELAKKQVKERYSAVCGAREFKHDIVKNAVLAEFEKALACADNDGKADEDIFNEITSDKGYFATAPAPMQPIGEAAAFVKNEGKFEATLRKAMRL